MNILGNWKTSSAGLAGVLTGLSALLTMAAHGQLDPQSLGVAIVGIVNGVGLIFAKDANK